MLVTEVSYPVYRPQFSSLYNTLWYSGNIMYVTPLRPLLLLSVTSI